MLLHGLTDWFRDYPLHWFGIAMLAVIVPASVAIGHHHNRTQQKTESRNLTHLNPYINTIIPNSKEVYYESYMHMMIELMISSTRDPELRAELVKLRAAVSRYMAGEPATGSLDGEAGAARPRRQPFPTIRSDAPGRAAPARRVRADCRERLTARACGAR